MSFGYRRFHKEKRPLVAGLLLTVALAVNLVCLAMPATRGELTGVGEPTRFFGNELRFSRDGSTRLIETIEVVSAGDKLRHGIIRRLPRIMEGPSGVPSTLDYELISAHLDSVPVSVEGPRTKEGAIEYRVGDSKESLVRGVHTFRIEWKVLGLVRTREDHTMEARWNLNWGWNAAPPARISSVVIVEEGSIEPRIVPSIIMLRKGAWESRALTLPHEAFSVKPVRTSSNTYLNGHQGIGISGGPILRAGDLVHLHIEWPRLSSPYSPIS